MGLSGVEEGTGLGGGKEGEGCHGHQAEGIGMVFPRLDVKTRRRLELFI